MATIDQKDSIDIAAPANVIYDLIIEQLAETKDAPSNIQKQRPLTEGPVRSGFRYEQTLIHNRHECRSEWTVIRAERPLVLEGQMTHFCAEARKAVNGGERWEMNEANGLTHVSLTTWTDRPGVDGLLLKWLGPKPSPAFLMKRLNYLQFEAERRTGAG